MIDAIELLQGLAGKQCQFTRYFDIAYSIVRLLNSDAIPKRYVDEVLVIGEGDVTMDTVKAMVGMFETGYGSTMLLLTTNKGDEVHIFAGFVRDRFCMSITYKQKELEIVSLCPVHVGPPGTSIFKGNEVMAEREYVMQMLHTIAVDAGKL